VRRAHRAGLRVILDVHNYGDYYLQRGDHGQRFALGTRQLPLHRLGDLWGRLSRRFESTPGVVGYGLMNEPAGMPRVRNLGPAQAWERASQLAVRAIRANGDHRLVLVQGYSWAGAQNWPRNHPHAWIHDPAHHMRYEAHHYWDSDHSGSYRHRYAWEVAAARRDGW
jgi:endoglucanase